MSRKFQNELCVYCARQPSAAPDHVFARSFFVESQRANLPQVPACQPCNNVKSRLEHYLATVLPFGGVHVHAAQMLQDHVPRRLAKNERLHRELAAGAHLEWTITAQGHQEQRPTVPFDGAKLDTLFAYIVRGLIYHHWSVYLPENYVVDAMSMREVGQVFWEKLSSHSDVGQRVVCDLGEATVRYEGIQSSKNPHLTAWQFQLFGGLSLTGDPQMPEESATMIIGRSVKAAARRVDE